MPLSSSVCPAFTPRVLVNATMCAIKSTTSLSRITSHRNAGSMTRLYRSLWRNDRCARGPSTTRTTRPYIPMPCAIKWKTAAPFCSSSPIRFYLRVSKNWLIPGFTVLNQSFWGLFLRPIAVSFYSRRTFWSQILNLNTEHWNKNSKKNGSKSV